MSPATKPLHTDEQARAITTKEVSVALAAGAGCGKTYVLTQRLLEELSPHSGEAGQSARERLNELVAITFTEAAARELRSRVRNRIAEAWRAASPAEQSYWQEMLRHFDDCRISTIHSFCSDLVRRHAFELGLDPLMTVLDAAAARVLSDEAIEDALRGLLAARDTDLMELAAEWNIDGVRRRLWGMMSAYRSATFAKWKVADPRELIDTWRGHYEQDVWPRQLARLKELVERVREVLQDHPAYGDEVKLARLFDLLGEIAEGNCSEPLMAEFGELANLRRKPLSKAQWQDDRLYLLFQKNLNDLRADLKTSGRVEFDGPETRRAAELGIRLTRIAGIAAESYETRKRNQGAIDFDDQLALAHQLLTDEAFGGIQREAQRQIRLLMVDEFQDTDELQTEIVRALAGNVIESNKLFFVGDEKQSIYRFRKAEPKVFRQLRGEVPEMGRLPLSVNFRSQPAILGFVNQLFATAFGDSYQPLSAHLPQVTEEPCIELLWTEVTESENQPGTDDESPTERVNAKDCRRIEARTIAARLRQLFDSQQQVVSDREAPGGCRPARYGDVAILFRALSDVQYYEEALRDAGIDYYLVGGHAFYAQQEVYDLLHLLRSVVSECDEISLVGVLRSPFFALSDETLYWLAASGGSLATGLFAGRLPETIVDPEEQRRVVAARRILSELRRMKDRASVSELLELAFERTGYDAALLAEFMGARKLANIQKLVEQARAAAASGVGKVAEFVTQLGKFVVEQPKEALATTSPEAANVVRLMTVHQAKGLEFPVVVVPDLARRPRAPFASGVFNSQLGPLVKPENWSKAEPCGLDLYLRAEREEEAAESTRLFYVACTRAKDYLVLSAAVADWEKVSGWMATLGQAFDLRDGDSLSGGEKVEVRVIFDHEVADPDKVQHQRHPSLARSLDEVEQRAARGKVKPYDLASPVALDPHWITRLSVSRLSGHLVTTPEADANDSLSPPWPEQPRAAVRPSIDPIALGNLVHAVMERVDLANPDEVAEWCRIFAPQYDLVHADQLANEANRLLAQFLAGPRAESMRAGRWIEREVEFHLAWPLGDTAPGGQTLQGYIDSLYEDQQGALRIVDYKTNQTTPEGVPQVASGYELQVLVYALAVEQSLGRGPDEMVLCFLRPGVEYAFAWNEQARQRAIALVDQAMSAFLSQPAWGRAAPLQSTL